LFAEGERVRAFEGLRHQAEKRPRVLESAAGLRDLAQLPSNRLEALSGSRQGQYSIRINRQWRICFEWPQGADGPENVEIVDYH
jgi:proteic killer suppression protein